MRSYRTALILGGVLVILLGIWWGASRWYKDRLILELRSQVLEEVNPRGAALSIALNRRLTRLQGLYAFVQAEPSLEDFNIFTQELFAGSRGIQHITVSPDNVVQYIYPSEDSDGLLGTNLLDEINDQQLQDMERSVRLRLITLSAPIISEEEQTTLSTWLAVYQQGKYWGMLSMELDVSTLVKEADIVGGPEELSFALKDSNNQVFYGDAQVFENDPILYEVDLPEESWTLAAAPLGGWSRAVATQVREFQAFGLVIIGLISGIVYLTISRQAQLTEAVRLRTLEIAALNQDLEQRVKDRTQELDTLLQTARSVASTLDLQPLLVRVLDQLRKVVDYQAASVFLLEEAETLTLLEYRGPLHPAELVRQYDLKTTDHIHLKRVIQSGEPVVLPDAEVSGSMPDLVSAAKGRKHSWMGIPLMVKGRVIGMLALENQERLPYTEQQANLALAFADQSAVAIDNARLYQQAHQLAALRERQKLARELHDSVSQALYGIVLGVRTAQAKLGKKPEEAKEAIDYVLSLAEGGLHEMRALIFELRPESLENEGVVAALKRQVALLKSRHGIHATGHFPDEPDVSLEVKETLYRIAREAVQNIIKHADAQTVVITLSMADETIRLEVQDDGRGFNPAGSFPGHLGLLSMRERAEHLNGRVDIQSSPQQGTLVKIVLPCPT